MAGIHEPAAIGQKNRATRAGFPLPRVRHMENADPNAAGPLPTGLLRSAPPSPGERWNRKASKEHGATRGIMPPPLIGVVDGHMTTIRISEIG